MGVRSIEIRAFVHATEDEEKVVRAILEALPEDLRGSVKIEREEYTGHYGNPILILRIYVNEPGTADRILSYLLERMSSADRRALLASLEDRVDREGSFYMRISKQEAYQGRIVLYEADDVIRISVGFSGRRRKAMEEYKRRLQEND